MAYALAIETSGRNGSVALCDEERVCAERSFEHGLANAAKLLPLIDEVCRENGVGPRDLRTIYVSIGPGSFTGLRIAVTMAKTLAMATGAKIVAVPTARVLVENAPAEAGNVIIVLDAKRKQIFTARYERREGAWQEAEAARLDSLTAMLERSPRPVYLLGEGIPYHEAFVPREDGVMVTSPESWIAKATTVARLGAEMARRGEYVDPLKLQPVYIRLPEAEEKRLAAGG